MVELAMPISKLFDSEESAKRIISASDCLECRDESLSRIYPKQFLFHFDLSIIHEWGKQQKDYLYSAILSKTELKLITFHMASSYDNAIIKDGMYLPHGRPYTREELFFNANENVAWLRTFIKENISIGVENNNYYPTLAYRYITDGDFITQIVRDNAICLLFDLAHARITAYNKAVDYKDYKATLPLDAIIQAHLCKPSINKVNMAYDAHELPDVSILQETETIVKETPVEYLTIEYYQEVESLVQVLGECQRFKEVLVSG